MSKDTEAEPMLFLDEYTELSYLRSDLINVTPRLDALLDTADNVFTVVRVEEVLTIDGSGYLGLTAELEEAE